MRDLRDSALQSPATDAAGARRDVSRYAVSESFISCPSLSSTSQNLHPIQSHNFVLQAGSAWTTGWLSAPKFAQSFRINAFSSDISLQCDEAIPCTACIRHNTVCSLEVPQNSASLHTAAAGSRDRSAEAGLLS
ncbi:hypothetical protein BGZ61DRAFT_454867 [Ilyonectria robusta]|uniref:uncharacterized protein n=1 Tax=Ilyonectria robusta TaxID=1079257 RepID=UPI001E8D637C|nr:uncharacterized protein BGZ61DRAFT_454867 [Ilyonectria robusta]KAH8685016.1 hypothetical protein BGZ61DRAFT_454867 [Ilyonectria robusta]